MLGDAELAVDVCERALQRGVVRAGDPAPHGRPRDSSRLRLAAMATHTPAEMRWAAAQLAAAVQEAGAEPRAAGAAAARSCSCTTARASARRPPSAPRRRSSVGTPGLFVTGTDTDVGKTVLASAVAATLAGEGERVRVFKPAVTGLAEQEPGQPPDHEMLRARPGRRRTGEAVAPYRFGPAVSPHLAAGRAGRAHRAAAPAGCLPGAAGGGDVLVVEGVGGLLVPLAGGYLVRDLAAALGFPVLIAARPGLARSTTR